MMDARSKILLAIACLLSVVSIGATFFKTIVVEDYEVVYDESDLEEEVEEDISEESSQEETEDAEES